MKQVLAKVATASIIAISGIATAQSDASFELKGIRPGMKIEDLSKAIPELKLFVDEKLAGNTSKVMLCGPATAVQNSCGSFSLAGFPVGNIVITAFNDNVCNATFVFKSNQDQFNNVQYADIFSTLVTAVTDKMGVKPAADPGNHSWTSASKDLELWIILSPPHKGGWTRLFMEVLSNKCSSQFKNMQAAITEDKKRKQSQARTKDL